MIFIVMKKRNGMDSQKVFPYQVSKVSVVGNSVIVTAQNEEYLSPMDKDCTMTWWYMGCPEVFSEA